MNGHTARPLRVLVVEDCPDAAESLDLLLRLHGFETQIASGGLAALEAVQARPPDVVLLDLGLPGLNGYEVAKHLRALVADKRPLVIAVTGYGRDEDRQRSQQAGIDLHLVKPVDPEQLMGILRRFQAILAPGTSSEMLTQNNDSQHRFR